MYEVKGTFGTALFTNVNDAINALWLCGTYHSIDVQRVDVLRALDEQGYWECFPIAIAIVEE